MIRLKTPADLKIIKAGGQILATVIEEIISQIKPGVGTKELNDLAERLISRYGGRPSFKGYKAAWSENVYPAALCLSINEEVVHGLPLPNRLIKDGDIVGIDCGLEYQGYFTDMAKTIAVGSISAELQKLIQVAHQALVCGIEVIRPGKEVADISRAIQNYVESQGFSVVRQLVGHGVGFSAHEDPQIPNYIDKNLPRVEIKPGMVLALEPMINAGGWEVETLPDGWTVATIDRSHSAHFEHTVAVTNNGYEILTIKEKKK